MAAALCGAYGGRRDNSGRKRKYEGSNSSQKAWNSQHKRIHLSLTIFESWKDAKIVAGYGLCSDSDFAAHLLSLEYRRRMLTRLLDNSKDPLILSVSAHDIGEYVRHYPRGKSILETLGCKELVMKRMAHHDPNVRYEALLAVQKFMVHNWEYLGRQLNPTS